MSNAVSTQRSEGDVINLALGHPSPALLPLAMVRRAAAARLSSGDRLVLQYGLEPGDHGFRTLLGQFLAREGVIAAPVAPEELFITAGISGALDLICTVQTQPGDTVAVEDPTYFLADKIFRDHGLRIVTIPTDDLGAVPDEMTKVLAAERPRLLYLIPAYQNPTGTTLIEERRQTIAELCREHDTLLLADEAYHLLGFESAPPRSFATYAAEAPVMALGSFSKILGPGLRLGWVHAAPERLKPLIGSGLYDSGGGANPFAASVVRSVLELGMLAEHLRALRVNLASRRDALLSALEDALGPRYILNRPGGGYFVWVRGPRAIDADALVAAAARRKVGIMPGSRCSPSGSFSDCLRISFSYYEPPELRQGVQRLAAALELTG